MLNLIVIELMHEELATEEDIACGIDKWVRLFKAKTRRGYLNDKKNLILINRWHLAFLQDMEMLIIRCSWVKKQYWMLTLTALP
jgi:hypothetical protein